MTRARDIADLGQDKSTLASYVDTGVTSTDLERIDITTEGTSENSKVVTADSSGHVTLAGELRGPATLVIDPAVVGNNTGLLQVKGNLQVDGTTTTINSTTLTVDDKNIVLGSGAADSAAADGSGITIDGASATMLYTHSTTSFDFNKPVNVTGALTASSNVGINTSTPTALIDIDASSKDAVADLDDPNDYAIVIRNPSSSDTGNGIAFTNDGATNVGGAILHEDKGSNNLGDLAFYTNSGSSGNPTERMRIQSNGNVGINGASGGAMLDVNGTVALGAGADISGGHVAIKSDGTGTDGAFFIANNDGTALVKVLDNGKVGIGNTAPEVDLHIGSYQSGSGQTATLRLSEGNGSGASTGFDVKYVGSSDKLFFTSKDGSGNFADRMVITRDDGKVGIGSSAPSSLLHLENDNLTNIDKPLTLRNDGTGSTLANTFTAIRFQVGDANAGPSESGHIGAGQVGESGTWSNDSRMMFWVGNAGPTVSNPKMVIDGSGSITTPNGSFNGTIGSSATMPTGTVVKQTQQSFYNVITNSVNTSYTYSTNRTTSNTTALGGVTHTTKIANPRITVWFSGQIGFQTYDTGVIYVWCSLFANDVWKTGIRTRIPSSDGYNTLYSYPLMYTETITASAGHSYEVKVRWNQSADFNNNTGIGSTPRVGLGHSGFDNDDGHRAYIIIQEMVA